MYRRVTWVRESGEVSIFALVLLFSFFLELASRIRVIARSLSQSPPIPCAHLFAVILATDGFFDNIFKEAIPPILARYDFNVVRDLLRLRAARADELKAIDLALEASSSSSSDSASHHRGPNQAPHPSTVLESRRILSVAPTLVLDGELAQKEKEVRSILASMSTSLALAAVRVGNQQSVPTPFAKEAARFRFRWEGGKPDDVTVIVALVV